MASLDLTFAALGNPTRRGIVVHLARGEATVSELVDQFDLSQPTISSHIKVLESAGNSSQFTYPSFLDALAYLRLNGRFMSIRLRRPMVGALWSLCVTVIQGESSRTLVSDDFRNAIWTTSFARAG